MPAHTIRSTTLATALLTTFAAAQGFQEDWLPTDRRIELNTDFTTIRTASGRMVPVRNGIFVLGRVVIPATTEIVVRGSNPLVFVTATEFRLDGTLRADGLDGERVDTLNSANFPSAGGLGGPGAGRGGRGSPNATDRSPSGEPGFGPGNAFGGGGGAGALSCTPACGRGSGGGGGSFGTVGDLDHLLGATSWAQVTGVGGFGCRTGTLAGGAPGASPFRDGRFENDFWGIGVDVRAQRFVVGELPGPLGGSGGGGGGDLAPTCQFPDPAGFLADSKGGGGGGGGGAVVIVSLGRIAVGPAGQLTADGGDGGGGEQAGSNNEGGGGGGGSGGMIVLAAAQGIELHVDGATYAGAGDARFVLSADGGIGKQGRFSGLEIAAKYPIGNPAWARNPAGGFGGLGLIQLAAPIGDNSDGTNTVLDDGIRVVANGQVLTGLAKVQALGWRGYPDGQGRPVDDFGLPTDPRSGTGEMRPSPALLPYFR